MRYFSRTALSAKGSNGSALMAPWSRLGGATARVMADYFEVGRPFLTYFEWTCDWYRAVNCLMANPSASATIGLVRPEASHSPISRL